jgi:hypothetical protein
MELKCEFFTLWWQKCLGSFPFFNKNVNLEKKNLKNEKKLPNSWNQKIEKKKKAIARWDFILFYFSKIRRNLESNTYTEVHGLRCQKNLKCLITLLFITQKNPSLSQCPPKVSGGRGASKKRQNYQIYLASFECVVKDIEVWL